MCGQWRQSRFEIVIALCNKARLKVANSQKVLSVLTHFCLSNTSWRTETLLHFHEVGTILKIPLEIKPLLSTI